MLPGYLNLLREMTVADFKLRYYGSVLGVFWAFAKPFLIFAVLYTVFSFITRFSIENYAWFLLLGIIFWSFFADATAKSVFNLGSKAEFIKRINFPKEIIIYSACLNSLITLLLNLFAYTTLLIIFGGPLQLSLLLLIIPILQVIILATGVSFFLAVVFVKARDIVHIWEVALQALFWLTPIVYPVSIIPQKYRIFVMLNPIAVVVGAARTLAIYNTMPQAVDMLLVFAFSAIVLLLGLMLFRRQAKYFAEEL